jgi:hypothetical protein
MSNKPMRTLISMMARSTTRSNQRPDTLMRDRKAARSMKPLATHGRTIHCIVARPLVRFLLHELTFRTLR